MPFTDFGIAGYWNASTNDRGLRSSRGIKGEVYQVSVPGTTTLNGVSDWQIDDLALFAGDRWVKLLGRGSAEINLIALDAALDRTGVASATPAFQVALNLPAAGKRIPVIVPEGTYNLATSPIAGAGIVDWVFQSGVILTGPGILPFRQSTMIWAPIYSSVGLRRSIWHGTAASPALDGPVALDSVIRVDQTAGADNASYLLNVRFTGLSRRPGASGWVQANATVVEDLGGTSATETVVDAAVGYMVGQGKIWAYYAQAHAIGANTIATSVEFDISNDTGTDYPYNESSPLIGPHTKGIWIAGFGANLNSFAWGLGAGTVGGKFGCAIYMATASVVDYAFDIQATPSTIMRFKNGVAGGHGKGIDFGVNAAYGYNAGEGAAIWYNHGQRFGATSNVLMYYDETANSLLWIKDGVIKVQMNLTTAFRNI